MVDQITFGRIPETSSSDTLLLAIFIATVVHATIILSVNFSTTEPEEVNRPIEITLANTPARKAPKKASFLAQHNQIGAGNKKSKPEPPKQTLPGRRVKPKRSPPRKPVTEHSKKAPSKMVATKKPAEHKTPPAPTPEPTIENKPQKPAPQLTAAGLKQQIAQLGMQIRERHQSADLSKIKHVSAVSAHRYVAAQYMRDWERKVERTGNLNYPEVARKKNFFGKLIMEVGINADGSVYSIRIKQSSGNPALDDAAKRIVRISGPFPPLPKELLKELDVLVITRVWKFSDESGMTSR